MNNTNACLLTIYTETILETRLVELIEEAGATGYTITNARGKGSGGTRSATWDADASIRVEIICSRNMANELTQVLQDTYYDNFSMVTFITDIEVIRQDKFE